MSTYWVNRHRHMLPSAKLALENPQIAHKLYAGHQRHPMSIPGERVSLEWLILADSAQVVGNKLYLAGGGWDLLTINAEFPHDQIIGLAASFGVPWSETNQPHL